MSKIKKSFLPLLVSVAMLNIEDLYASSAAAATTTDDDQVRTAMSTALSADHLSPNNKRILENIHATVDGRIRFNQGILRMLNDEKITVGERVSEYHEMQGTTLPQMAQEALEKLLQDAKYETTEEIETLRTTQIVCRVSESEKMSPKSGFLLAVNIYCTILSLELNSRHLSKAHKKKSISSHYSELPYYKKMQRYLRQSSLPKLHEITDNLFAPVADDIRFRCDTSNIEKASIRIRKLRRQYKKHLKDQQKDQQFDVALDSLLLHCQDFEKLNKILSDNIATSTIFFQLNQININFISLKKSFNICIWPYIETKLAIERLLTEVEKTEKQFNQLIKLSKIKSFNNNASSGSSTNDETQATKIAEPEPDLGEEEQQQEEAASAALGLSVAHEETEEPDTADTSASAAAFQQPSAPAPDSSSSHAGDTKTSSAASSSSSQSSTQSSDVFDWMKALRGEARIVDFSDMLKAFKQSFGDQEDFAIEKSQTTEVTFRGPSNQLTKIFCHTPHGSQLKKAWPGWRHNMIDGLEGSGFKLRT